MFERFRKENEIQKDGIPVPTNLFNHAAIVQEFVPECHAARPGIEKVLVRHEGFVGFHLLLIANPVESCAKAQAKGPQKLKTAT